MTMPTVVGLLGFGEAGSAVARGLAGGWRVNAPAGSNAARRLVAVDVALDADPRGRALGAEARRLEVAITGGYTAALSEADMVFSMVPGDASFEAASSLARVLKPGALVLDLCTITGAMAEADRAVIEAAGGRYVDVAVMGTFHSLGHKAPMLLAGPDADEAAEWMAAQGFDVKVLGPKPGSASSVKMLRSVLIKGIEALAVESLVAAREQNLLEEVLGCLGDVDLVPFRTYLSTLLSTHIVHATRRLEEMELVGRTLRETGIEPLMTEAIQRSHRRTVEAGILPADGRVPPLDVALKLLAEGVVKPDPTKFR